MPTSSRFSRLLQFNVRLLLTLTFFASLGMVWWTWNQRKPVDPQLQSLATSWDVATGARIKWTAKLGSVAYGGVATGDGKVFVGTNNSAGYLKRIPATVDKGVLLCFDQQDGKFLWQATTPKLPTGRMHDWPLQGVCSTPTIQGQRLWYVANNCHIYCLDTRGFHDGENDGPFKSESVRRGNEADIVWDVDLMATLGVSPHNMSCSNVVVYGHRLFLVTPNGVGPSHAQVVNPQAPSFVCLHKDTGKVLWQDASPGANVLHGQWASPALAMIKGQPQIIFPGGDGWLYSFDPRGDGAGGGKLLWKFDCNPKTSKWMLGGRGTRNNLIATPLVYQDKVYIATGQDPEHGDGPGLLWCIDPSGRGDVSPEIVTPAPGRTAEERRLQAADLSMGDVVTPNPNSRLVWKFDTFDTSGNGKIEFEETMHRTISRIRIKDDLLVVADTSGILHCLSATTGRPHWHYDLFASTWSSPIIAGDYFYIADEDGDVAIFRLSADPTKAMNKGNPINEIAMPKSIAASPAAANDVMFIAERSTLYAIGK